MKRRQARLLRMIFQGFNIMGAKAAARNFMIDDITDLHRILYNQWNCYNVFFIIPFSNDPMTNRIAIQVNQ